MLENELNQVLSSHFGFKINLGWLGIDAKDAYTEEGLKGILAQVKKELDWIKTSPGEVFDYSCFVLERRWPEAEEIIKEDPFYSYLYALNVIKGRWPEVEKIIMEDPESALFYALNIIKGRWPEAEEAIKKNKIVFRAYVRDVLNAV